MLLTMVSISQVSVYRPECSLAQEVCTFLRYVLLSDFLKCLMGYVFLDSIGSVSLLALDAVKGIGLTQPSWLFLKVVN